MSRILLVEDDPDIQTVARLALEAVGGHAVTVCSSGAEALHAAPELSPDLILLDSVMPEMDGPTTLALLRKLPETAHTPVIFLTANYQTLDCRRLGALGLIRKPFDPMTLPRQIWGLMEVRP